MSKPYAENTKVPVSQSQAEVKEMLRKLGADRMMVFESADENFVVFEIPNQDGSSIAFKLTQKVPDGKGSVEQRERAAWRAVGLLIKAKKVAIEQGITTIEKEFMADTVMPDGSTLIDHYQGIVDHNYTDGPPQIGWSGS